MTMYDKDFTHNRRVDIGFDQDATHTHATCMRSTPAATP